MSFRKTVWLLCALLAVVALLFTGYHFGTRDYGKAVTLEPEANVDNLGNDGSGQQADSPALGAGDSAPARARERVDPPRVDPYLESPSVFDMATQLLVEGELDEPGMASTMMVWSTPCRRAVQFAAQADRGQAAFGLSKEASQALDEFCGELADDMDGDAEGYSQAWMESAEEHVNPFWEIAERGDLGAAVKAAIEAIYRSRNEMEILQALSVVIHYGDLESPFAGVDREAIAHLFSWRIMSDAALALLCDNLGGCAGNHPLVARHCLQMEWHDGCYRPHDIYHAIEQTQTPIQQTVFWTLLNQIATMRRSLR